MIERGQDARDTSGDRERAYLYRLLANLLAGPADASVLGLLCDINTGAQDTCLGTALRALSEAAGRAQPEALEDEYNRLFIGVGRGELLPYASWYLTGSLLERPLIEVRRELRALGIARREGVCEPEDHIATLCEVMAVTIEAAGVDTWSRQQAFFQAHLAPWAGGFFRDLQVAEGAGFYRPVGLLGACLMELEAAYFTLLE